MRTTRLWATAATAALAVGTLTACGGDSPEENTADACTDWDTYTAALGDLVGTLGSEPTVGEVEDARDAVDDAWDDLEESLGDVAEDRAEELENAWDELSDAVDDLDDDATLGEAAQQISAQAQEVQSANTDVTAELGCE
ncbi:hypothetical protein [Isoptericola sp. AK164]|uniref:hypothetical protein n=1 Tax=Isoptericola sp. AK164 TaxID=3024246 RepID=UPI002418818A|nr:hypothetical protein [Isoptericola sp. AK164]